MTPPNLVNKPSPVQPNPYMPIQYMSGVGPHRAKLLQKLTIKTPADLLFHFPRDHQNREPIPIAQAKLGKKAALQGEILTVDYRQVGRMLGQARITIKDTSGVIQAIWFKRISYKYDVFSGLKRNLIPGRHVLVYGQIVLSNKLPTIRADYYEPLEKMDAPSIHADSIVPVYPLTEGIGEKWLRDLLARCVQQFLTMLEDPLPPSLRASHKLIPIQEAIRLYHFPRTWSDRDLARERLAFDEFFFLELALELNRQTRRSEAKGFQSAPTTKMLTPFRKLLGYEFTKGQTRAINEIFKDMANSPPMHRLLQGDVGSGKTVVALSAALLSIENGRQVAFLAPTEILAEQHKLTMAEYFENLSVRWALLTRSTPAPERKQILKKLSEGKIDILIGTHAILNSEVKFSQLGLVIIDEQHRFGVRQRARLMKDEEQNEDSFLIQNRPDVLIMTATPIPRTLALTLYGDLDVSIIDEMPKGRVPIESSQVLEESAMQKIKSVVGENRQVFVVLPLIEESEALSKRGGKTIRAATAEYEKLKKRFPGFNIGLLHGQLDSDSKKEIMNEFRDGKLSILVSTPVIEVGINVPNATLMVIMSPERFGLAQLHQLRGRVGRGSHRSECLLVREQKDDLTQPRLDIFCFNKDGFKLAEEDLKLRGPGELLGEAQHGVPFFRVGNLLNDRLLISQAREVAKRLVEGEIPMTMKEFRGLNQTLQNRFGHKMQLSQIG